MRFLRLLGPGLLVGPLVFLAISCGNGLEPTAPDRTGTTSDSPFAPLAAEKDYVPSQELLEWVYDQGGDDPDIVYEVACSGTVSLAEGGVISGHPATWPSDYGFTYAVLPGSIDPSSIEPGADSVTITVRVPVLDTIFPDVAEDAMPMILEPDGLCYIIPEEAQTAADSLENCAHLFCSFHPNLEPSCEGYIVFSADLEDTSGLYYTQEYYDVENEPLEPVFDKRADNHEGIDDDPEECSHYIYTRIQHHSRWAVDKPGGGPNGEPIIPPVGGPVSHFPKY